MPGAAGRSAGAVFALQMVLARLLGGVHGSVFMAPSLLPHLSPVQKQRASAVAAKRLRKTTGTVVIFMLKSCCRRLSEKEMIR